MPFAASSTIRFGDGPDEATSAALGTLTKNADGTVGVQVDGFPQNVSYDGAGLKDAVDAGIATRNIVVAGGTTDPARAWDIGDDPLGEGEKQVKFEETADQFKIDTGLAAGPQIFGPGLFEGLQLALVAAGF